MHTYTHSYSHIHADTHSHKQSHIHTHTLLCRSHCRCVVVNAFQYLLDDPTMTEQQIVDAYKEQFAFGASQRVKVQEPVWPCFVFLPFSIIHTAECLGAGVSYCCCRARSWTSSASCRTFWTVAWRYCRLGFPFGLRGRVAVSTAPYFTASRSGDIDIRSHACTC